MTFPNVPDVAGVPPLARDPLAAPFIVILLVADAVLLFTGLTIKSWGLFQDGIPLITADSVVTMGYKQDWSISNYPVEGGAFETYDKVQLPFEIRLQFSKGGSSAAKAAFLQSISQIAGNTQLYDVYTADAIYNDVTIMRYNYDREALKGVGLLVVDVYVIQVSVTATQQFSNTVNPASASPSSTGISQPLPASPAIQNSAGISK